MLGRWGDLKRSVYIGLISVYFWGYRRAHGFACGLRLVAVGLRLRPFLFLDGNSLCLLGFSVVWGAYIGIVGTAFE